MHSALRKISLLTLALALLILGSADPAYAATLTVTTGADEYDGVCDSHCSLRDAIAAAAGGDTITFAGDTTIYLNSELSIAKNLTIDGGAHTVTVSGDSGNDGSRNVRVFNIAASYTITLSHLNIVKGSADYGGGIYNKGALTLQDCTLADNMASVGGGGLWNESGTVTLLGSTVSGNVSSKNGGGILNRYNTLTVRNSTISGNRANDGTGGGIGTINGTTILQHSTLANNTALVNGSGTTNGGGIYQWGVTLLFYNTLIANNTGGDCYVEGGGSLAANVNNLVGDGSCSPLLSGDPLLGPLANNGGPSTGSGPATFTHALLVGSKAIDAGNNTHCLPTDQRGVARPISSTCDIGAFEAPAYPRLEATLTVTPTSGVAYDGGVVTYTLILKNTGPLADPQVSLTDTLPAEIDFKQWTTNSGATVNGNQITWQGVLASQAELRLVFQATHRFGLSVTNTVSISGQYQTLQASATFTAPCQNALTVANGNDAGDGSLRQAIADLCPSGVITFAGDTTIYLNSELSIAKNLTIDGGVNTVTISGDSGNDGSRNVRAFNIGAGRLAALQNLTITNTYHSDRGAGIYNAGNLTVSGCHFSKNTASGFGGAIYNYQNTLTVQDSVFSDNSSTNGGAINSFRGNVVVQNSDFSGNSASGNGGAIYAYQNSSDSYTMSVSNSTLVNNSAWYGGGIASISMILEVKDSALVGNTARYYGGGINFDSTGNFYRTFTVEGSTFSENKGGTVYEAYTRGGGGIYNYYGAMTIHNSTFSGNGAPESEGGAIVTWGSLSLLNSTLIGNSSRTSAYTSGVANLGDLSMKNTIIAGSFPGPDCKTSGMVTLNSLNTLVEDGTCNTNGDHFLTGDPLVGWLADHGGPRIGAAGDTPLRTHALLPGSPAIDAGDAATCLAADQRDMDRPQGAACDIGAFEGRGFSLTYAGGNDQTTYITTAFTNPLNVSLTETGGGGLPGAVVTFTFPPTGASAAAASITATTQSDGIASLPVTANNVVGGPYTVSASMAGLATHIDFALTNTPLPSVSLSVSAASGAEADQTVITVTAAASGPVVGDQTVNVSVSGTGITAGDYSLSHTALTIPDGQNSGSVTFTVQNDAIAEGSETATLTLNNPSSAIVLGSPLTQDIAIADNDTAGYTFSANLFSLAEGASREITVTLNSQPTAAVAIHLSSADATQCTVSPASVTLGADNWQSGAGFTVSGVNDNLDDDDQPCAIVATVSSADNLYNDLDPDDLSLTIVDHEEFHLHLPVVLKGQ